MDEVTHGKEILDLIFTNNDELVSSVQVTPWPTFTDHSIVTASVSYQIGSEPEVEELHLLDSGRRLKKLNFHKAPWTIIQDQLNKVDWNPMKEAAKVGPTDALNWLMDVLLPILEKHVPLKGPKRKSRNRMERRRKLLWRKLSKIQKQIQQACSSSKLSQLIRN